jgi:hypothetical protein
VTVGELTAEVDARDNVIGGVLPFPYDDGVQVDPTRRPQPAPPLVGVIDATSISGVTANVLAQCGKAAPASRRLRFDFAGAVTITAALVALAYAVVDAPEARWTDDQTLGLIGISAALIALFAGIEAGSAAPLMPLHAFAIAGARRRQPGAVRARRAGVRDAVQTHAVRRGGAALLAARGRARLSRDARDGGRSGRSPATRTQPRVARARSRWRA